MKNLKRFLSLLLVLTMVFALVACDSTDPTEAPTENAGTSGSGENVDPTEGSKIPDYLNVGQAPLVDEEITLRVAILCHDNTVDPESTWMFSYIEEVLGINLELEYFYQATRDENVALMMADGNLPDIMIGMGLTANELTRYGSVDGLLLDVAPYLNEENAPNIMEVINEHPDYLAQLTNAEGQVFSIGSYKEREYNTGIHRMFYNYDILEAAGVESCPTTLDEFMTMLRTVKSYSDANSLGIIPFGGNWARYNATYLILNALGFNYSMDSTEQRSHETEIALRNGEVTLICYDKEAFPKYLETMHTIYSEGLMEQDYYTLDKETTKAHLAAGTYAVFSEKPFLYGGEEFGQQWWGGVPLTSEYNDTPFWTNYSDGYIGSYVISAETEYPELCVAFADYWFADGNRRLISWGPSVNQEELFLGETTGWYWNEELGEYTFDEFLANQDAYQALQYWRFENIILWQDGTFIRSKPGDAVDENGVSHAVDYNLEETDINVMAELRHNEEMTGTKGFNYMMHNTWGRYLTDELSPKICYFDEETTIRVTELKTLIDDYASQEIAKFIIGERPLSEIDEYFAELEALGADEYVQYYADYYEASK